MKKPIPAASSSHQTDRLEPDSPLVKTLRRAYSQYRFKPYDGQLVFLRLAKADAFGAGRNKVDFGWERYARKGVEVHELPGHHESLFRNVASVEQIARIIESYLLP
jgi:thioesterase domain-containing protein